MSESERQRRIEALFEQALDYPTTERSAFLIRACGSDRTLRSQVKALLAADDGADAYFADLAHRLGMPHVEEARGGCLYGRGS